MPDYFATPLEAPVWVASYAELLARTTHGTGLLQEVAANLGAITRAVASPARSRDVALMHAERPLTTPMVGPQSMFSTERLVNQNILHLNMLALLDEAAFRADQAARRDHGKPVIGNHVWRATVRELDRMQHAWLGRAGIDPELVERFTGTIAPLSQYVAANRPHGTPLRPAYAELVA